MLRVVRDQDVGFPGGVARDEEAVASLLNRGKLDCVEVRLFSTTSTPVQGKSLAAPYLVDRSVGSHVLESGVADGDDLVTVGGRGLFAQKAIVELARSVLVGPNVEPGGVGQQQLRRREEHQAVDHFHLEGRSPGLGAISRHADASNARFLGLNAHREAVLLLQRNASFTQKLGGEGWSGTHNH